MRSVGSTYLGLDLSVVSFTKRRTASFEGPSFQAGSGLPSVWPIAIPSAVPRRAERIAAAPVETNARRLKFLKGFCNESPFIDPPIRSRMGHESAGGFRLSSGASVQDVTSVEQARAVN